MISRAFSWVYDNPRRSLFLFFLISLALRLAVVLLRKSYLLDLSHTDHGELANNVAKGLGYVFRKRYFASSYFGPIFTYLWAWCLFLWGLKGQLAIQLANAVWLSACPLLVYPFSRLYFKREAALLGCFWLAFYPELLVLSSTMFADSLVIFLWCWCLWLFTAFIKSNRFSPRLIVLFGLAIALLVLTKGRMALFIPILVIGLALTLRAKTLQNIDGINLRPLITVLLVAVCTSAFLTPWVVRNYKTHQRLILFESSSGYNLWIGHNPAATGTGKARSGLSNYHDPRGKSLGKFPFPKAFATELAACSTEIEQDDVYRRHAIQFIRQNPGKEVELALKKMLYSWYRDPTNLLTKNPAYLLPWLGTLVLFGVGLVKRIVIDRKCDWILLSILIVSTLLQVVFFVVPRLRYPVYPIVFLYAGYAGTLITSRFQTK